MENEMYFFCSPDSYSVCFFFPSQSDDSPFIAHEVLGAFLHVVLIECIVSIYVILLCMNVYGICRVILLPKGNWFSLCTQKKKCVLVLNKLFLNCKKASFATDSIISQSFIFTLLKKKILSRILKLITERH